MRMARETVYSVLDGERAYQDRKWGPRHDDDERSVANFIIYMERYLDKAKAAFTDQAGEQAALHELRKVTALGVACMELFGAPARDESIG